MSTSNSNSNHKAALIPAAGQGLQIITAPTPSPTSGQVLVHVLSVHVTPDYKAIFSGLIPFLHQFPLVPGGGCIGRVEAVGSDAISIEPGQLVYVDQAVIGRDDPSQKIVQGVVQGLNPLAAKLGGNGWRNGTLAEKAIVPLENVIPLNEKYLVEEKGYSFDKIFIVNRFMIPYAGYELAKLKPGDTVIVAFATGALGNAAVEVALALGAGHVIGLGRDQSKLDAWKLAFPASKAARVTTVSLTGDVVNDSKLIIAATPNTLGADIYFDLSPATSTPTTFTHIKACIGALKIKGRVLFMGGISEDISIPYFDFVTKDLRLFGGLMYDLTTPRAVIRMLEMDLLSLEGYETKSFAGLDKLEEALEYASGHRETRSACFINP